MADMHLMNGISQCNESVAKRHYEEHILLSYIPAKNSFQRTHKSLPATGTFDKLVFDSDIPTFVGTVERME